MRMSGPKFVPEMLLAEKVAVDLMPEKKGLIKKHAEYLVTYDGFGIQVCLGW